MGQLVKKEPLPYLNVDLKNLEGEEWRDIDFTEGIYQVSNLGRVKSIERVIQQGSRLVTLKERILKQHYSEKVKGLMIKICCKSLGINSKGCYVNRLVAFAFLNSPLDNENDVIHINHNDKDNRLFNLKWSTRLENTNREIRLKRFSKSMKKFLSNNPSNFNNLLSTENRLKAAETRKKGVTIIIAGIPIQFKSVMEATEFMGCGKGTISQAIKTQKELYGLPLYYSN